MTEKSLWDKIINKEIVISPLLQPKSQIGGGSVNLRLGTKFIITKRTEYGVLDPSKLSSAKINKFQAKHDLTFGQIFMLHPRQLVLAATFEFIKLPDNICAHVLTRSKYGRLGLIIATAAFVHPNWRGCLTLELFNYGDAPIALRCGSAIAQLILQYSDNVNLPKKEKKFTYIPTEPLFSHTSEELEWKLLNYIKDLYTIPQESKSFEEDY